MLKELPMMALAPNTPMTGDEEQVALGMRHNHQQLNVLTQEILTASAEVTALIKILHQRKLVSEEEMKTQLAVEAKRVEALYQERELGVQIDDSEEHRDKYAIPADALPDIDCAARYHLCHAACCSLRFPLSQQDLDEGVARWEYGRPYMIRHGEDETCVHKDRETQRCTIYANRPATCRTYSCRGDKRIWQDFDNRVINPDLFGGDQPGPYLRPHFPTKQIKKIVTLRDGEVVRTETIEEAPQEASAT